MKYLGFLFCVSLLVLTGCPMSMTPAQKGLLDDIVEIRGDVKVGSEVKVNTSRLNEKDNLAFQWYVEKTPIAGAVGDSYTIKPTDKNGRLKVEVSRGGNGKRAEDSRLLAITHPVSDPSKPSIGKKLDLSIINTFENADVGAYLIAKFSRKDPTDLDVSPRITWYRSDIPIPEAADDFHYRLTAADAGHTITISAWMITKSGVVFSDNDIVVAGTKPVGPKPPETTPPETTPEVKPPTTTPGAPDELPPSTPSELPPTPSAPPAGSSTNPVFRTNLFDSTYMVFDAPQALSVNVNGGQLTYQWYETTGVNVAGQKIAGKTSASYSPSTEQLGTRYYYVEVTNIDWWPENLKPTTVRSATAKITVIERKGGGSTIGDDNTKPDAVEARFRSYLSKTDFETLFPRRVGSPGWKKEMPHYAFPNWSQMDEYYSYENLIKAVRELANWGYVLETRDMPGGHTNYNSRGYIVSKTSGQTYPVFEEQGFNAEWNQSKPIIRTIVDYGSFISSTNTNDNRRELAAFLANVAHETGAGWAGAPGGEESWGLFFNEEIAVGQDGYTDSYTSHESTEYRPVPGQSYHGRGSIQLSWNYNYGPFSILAFGNKDELLKNPRRVSQEGKLGWMSGLWFWMTPQLPKASSHDVIQSTWKPEGIFASASSKGITWGFGATIDIINGGFEAGGRQKQRRINHYKDIAGKTGANIQGEKMDTTGMSPWA